jgi:hypothetical protein
VWKGIFVGGVVAAAVTVVIALWSIGSQNDHVTNCFRYHEVQR